MGQKHQKEQRSQELRDVYVELITVRPVVGTQAHTVVDDDSCVGIHEMYDAGCAELQNCLMSTLVGSQYFCLSTHSKSHLQTGNSEVTACSI
mmetsp:Transcript_1079/g.3087  ORF Transcript_1079/g.3087 Transcript_1079/m.3087 type:complete len:92 (-) Transcript_1079:48-323(-)